MGVEAEGWIELARSMITEFGRDTPVTFTRKVVGEYETSALGRPAGTPVTYTVVSAPINFKLRELDGVTITSGEKILYIPGRDTSANLVEPRIGDTVALEKVYRVLEVIPFETESVNCAYALKIGA